MQNQQVPITWDYVKCFPCNGQSPFAPTPCQRFLPPLVPFLRQIHRQAVYPPPSQHTAVFRAEENCFPQFPTSNTQHPSAKKAFSFQHSIPLSFPPLSPPPKSSSAVVPTKNKKRKQRYTSGKMCWQYQALWVFCKNYSRKRKNIYTFCKKILHHIFPSYQRRAFFFSFFFF